MVATGTFIWLDKQARKGRPRRTIRAGWWGVTIGVPVAIGVTLIARLIWGNGAPFVAIFWIATLAITGAAMHRSRRAGARGTASATPGFAP